MEAIATKTTGQDTIATYNQDVAELNTWFDTMIKKIDGVDVGSGLNCAQKLDAIAAIQNECEVDGQQKLNNVKQKAHDVIEIINNLEAQQVQEKLKSCDRRYNDIIKRVARKAQMVAATNKGIQAVQNEIDQLANWLQQQIANLHEPQSHSSDVNLLNVRLQKLKAMLKDADVKKVLADTLERRVSNMQSDLEPSEKSQLESDLREINQKQSELVAVITAEIDGVTASLERQKSFENDVDKFKSWLRTKFTEIRKQSPTIPLQSKTVESEIQLAKNNENEIIKTGTESLNELQKHMQNILKNCDDRQSLDAAIDSLANEFDELKNEAAAITKHLSDACDGRRAFENDVTKLENWLSEVEISTQTDIQIKSLPILEEQLLEFEKLRKQKDEMRPILNALNDRSKTILPTLNNADKLKLNEQLKVLKDRFNKPTINDRIKTIEEHIKRYKSSKDRLAQCIETLQKLRQEIADLNKPIGIDAESVKSLIGTYERIIRDLNENKSKVNAIQLGSDLPELPHTVQQHDETIAAAEKQVANLRQAQLLREQYHGLIEQIENLIDQYGIQILDIEKSGKPIEDKLNQYDEMTAKIQECEGMLVSTSDKGSKIAAEGGVADSNAITDINQRVKQKLQNLHQQVKAQRQKHETTMAEQNKICSELADLLAWLHENETACKSRPLLERDPDSVERQAVKHDAFAQGVHQRLAEIQKIDEQIGVDSDGTTPTVCDLLAEGRLLMANLPKELDERRQYLVDSKQHRIDYIKYVNEFKDWINQAESHLESCNHGIDFANIVSDMDKFNSFFENDRPVKELLSQKIQTVVDQIWPTLQTIEQNELSEEVRHHKKQLEKVLAAAKQHRAQFEKYNSNWDSYRDLFNTIRSIIDSVKLDSNAADTLANIQANLRHASNVLIEFKVSVVSLLFTYFYRRLISNMCF